MYNIGVPASQTASRPMSATCRLQDDIEVLAQQSQRRLEAEVAAATAAGQAAVADAVRTHNMALAAVQSVSERDAVRLKAELATAQDGLAAAQRTCVELEQLRAETELARGQLQQQLEHSWKQLEVCTSFMHPETRRQSSWPEP